MLNISGPDAAIPHLLEALRYAERERHVIDETDIAIIVANTALAAGELDNAVSIYSAVSSSYERCGVVLARWQQEHLDSSLAALRETLGDDRFEELWAEGAAMSFDEMVDYARDYLGMNPV